ncbi:polysaccharide deacetylase family protein [Marinilabiliaceae bacterium ANBcel2]|nr:polysaccharide deacetylase family protein [Marinilabiliaceae bacterium ANBcel2]
MLLISKNRRDYILSHLKRHYQKNSIIDNAIVFAFQGSKVNSLCDNYKSKIIFKISDRDSPLDKPFWLDIKQRKIPVLFPLSSSKKPFFIDKDKNLIFNHDFLSSAFYFIASVEEYNCDEKDFAGRFPFKRSLQYRLNIVDIPVVNYYFDIILQGFTLYAKMHNFKFEERRMFDNFCFFLSHDVDRVAFFSIRETLFKLKQLIGLAPLYYNRGLTFKLFLKGLRFNMTPFRDRDPWWNFDYLISVEKALKIRSTYYFLNRSGKNKDARYSFKNKKVAFLIERLNIEGFETSLHGSFDSVNNAQLLNSEKEKFKRYTGVTPVGIRQHYLRFNYPGTFKIQKEAGFKYDTTLGFAEHEGFRNGYCYPFKPYDLNNDREIDIVEIPLVVMDVTVLNYRGLCYSKITDSTISLIDEVEKFGGLFSLLWHNCRLDEYLYPGIYNYYCSLLKLICDKKPQNFTGKEIADRYNQL